MKSTLYIAAAVLSWTLIYLAGACGSLVIR